MWSREKERERETYLLPGLERAVDARGARVFTSRLSAFLFLLAGDIEGEREESRQ